MVRYSKRRSRDRKRHYGGSGLSPLNPTSVDFASKESLTDIQRIPITNPSPILARAQPFIPPRPGPPSPPPPLGPTSGPAFGLKIGPPPLLSFGGAKGGGCGCMSKGGKRKKRNKSRRKKGGGNIHLPNPFGKLSFDANPFDNQSDSSTGQVSSEQAAADKNHGAFSSSEHTAQLHANTVLGTGGKRRKSKRRHRKMRGGVGCNTPGVISGSCALKQPLTTEQIKTLKAEGKLQGALFGGWGRKSKRHRKMKGGGDFFKNLFNMGEKNSNSSGSESKHSDKHSDKHESKNEDKHEPKNEKEVDWNPFDNQSDSSTGQVSAEQAAADKRQGAESSSSYTKQLDFKTLWENAFEHGKISGGKRRKSKKFKKHYMWNTKGKRYIAKTHKQHLRGVKLGHTHKKPKRK